ncbi:MAG: methyltransferase [Micromonosporaceae bacterium]|nr:methyltransferase [Micromonosporaceae bacterium]
MTDALLDADGIARLRDALRGAQYTRTGVAGRIGEAAVAAARRRDLRPALRAAGTDDPLATLIRLFIGEQNQPATAVARALHPLPLAAAQAAGLVVPAPGGGIRAGLDLEPYGDGWWILADRPPAAPGPVRADHVLGVGGASATLVNATVRAPVRSALDLGTGCGVQALHLATHATRVTATDLSRRALRFAATAAALAGQEWELVQGDFAQPVAGRRYDLVVSNPPFVAGPPGPAAFTYRDSGRAGDRVGAELAAAAPGLLAEGGTMQYLANWLHVAGQPWQERVAAWFAGSGLCAWAIQREVSDPQSYVDLWLADVGEQPAGAGTGTGQRPSTRDTSRREAWLDWFDAQKVEAVGFGLVCLRRSEVADPVLRVEELRQPTDRLGDQIALWFERQDWLRAHRTDLLSQRYRTAPGLLLHQEATHGPDGWLVQQQRLQLSGGLRWNEPVDPLVLELVSGCDGSVPLAGQLAVLAAAHGVPEEELADAAVPSVAHLVERGFIAAAP